jgi:hypothetical protein
MTDAERAEYSKEFNTVVDDAQALEKEYNMEYDAVIEHMRIVELRKTQELLNFMYSRLSGIEDNTSDTAKNTKS